MNSIPLQRAETDRLRTLREGAWINLRQAADLRPGERVTAMPASRSVIVHLKEDVPVMVAIGNTKRIELGKSCRAELVCRYIDTELAVATDRSPDRIVRICQS